MTDHTKALYDFRWDQLQRAPWAALRENSPEATRDNHTRLCRVEAQKAPVAAPEEIGGCNGKNDPS